MFSENDKQREYEMVWPSVFLLVAIMAAPFGFGLLGDALAAQILSGVFLLLGIVALVMRFLADRQQH